MSVDALVKKVLSEIGLNPERFNLKWASAAEAPRFVQLVTEYTAQIKELGPLGYAEGISPEDVKERIDRALALLSDKKLRVGFGNVTKTLRKEGNKLTDAMIIETIDAKLSKTISAGLE